MYSMIMHGAILFYILIFILLFYLELTFKMFRINNLIPKIILYNITLSCTNNKSLFNI